MNIVLCGFKNAGKTTFGSKLAKKYAKTFIDTDLMILNECYCDDDNLEISRLYSRVGNTEFRQLERVIVNKLRNVDDSVIATGGGTVLDECNVAVLRDVGNIIYLDVPKEILWERFTINPRPAYFPQSNIRQYFDDLYLQRDTLYRQVADYTVDATDFVSVSEFIAGVYGSK